MSASAKCSHPETEILVTPTHFEDEDVVILTVHRVHCKTCGAQFKFRGLSGEPSPKAPWVSCDGFSAALPMIEVEPRRLSS